MTLKKKETSLWEILVHAKIGQHDIIRAMVFQTRGEHSGQNKCSDSEFTHGPEWSFMACLGKKHSLLNIPNKHNNCMWPCIVHL